MAAFVAGAEVQLYYNNAKKFETTSTGIDVTGTVTADGLTVDGDTAANGTLTLRTSNNAMMSLIDTSASFRPSIRFMKDDGGVTQLHMLRDENGELDILRGASSVRQARFGSNGDISFYDSGGSSQSFYWVAADERLGIGTTLPSAPLSVTYGGGAVGAQITGNANYAQMQLSAAGANTNAYFTFGANGTGKGIIQRNAVDVIAINSSGLVGIGTTSPTGSLHTTVKDSNGSDVFVVAQNTTSNRVAGFRVLDESGTTSLQMQYDNGGNNASIINPNNGSLAIYLGGTGAANKLDDYEEGTWTPTLYGHTTAGTTSGTLTGKYTKIGREVFATVSFSAVSLSSAGGRLYMGGLPYTAVSGAAGGGLVTYMEGFNPTYFYNVDSDSNALTFVVIGSGSEGVFRPSVTQSWDNFVNAATSTWNNGGGSVYGSLQFTYMTT
jgi:hypothetical protein